MITSVDELFLTVSSLTRVTDPIASNFFVVQCDDDYQRCVVLRYLMDVLGLHYRDGFVFPDVHTGENYPNVVVYRAPWVLIDTRSQENLIPYGLFAEIVGLVGFEDHDPPQDLKLPPVSSLLFDQQPPVAAGSPGPVARAICPPSETPSQTERRPVYET